MQKKQLGQILVDSGKITDEQIEQALEYKKNQGVYLGKAIIALGFLTESELMITLADQLNMPYLNLMNYEPDNDAVVSIGEKFARGKHVMPLFLLGDELTVAISDPLNINLVDDLINQNEHNVNLVLSTESDIEYAIELYYGASKYVADDQGTEDVKKSIRVISKELDEDTQAVEAIEMLLAEAIKIGASDIHIEPREKDVRIRFRLDGVLQQYYTLSRSSMNALISRIKILSEMDIAESRAPQDGRFSHLAGNIKVDLRTSTFPTPNGEKVVMRILDEARGRIDLDKLGFQAKMLKQWKKVISLPNGIVLVSGPTGSGKTTSLYATLNMINSVEVNIMTIEDPIEYTLENINQSQVNERAGVTFPTALKSMLRQDPDIILVGEMRDVETIELSIRAALTGHLVFSTIHTNDATSTFTRLLDMGLDPYLISSTIRAILAQRLIRTLCNRCKKPVKVPKETFEKLGLTPVDQEIYDPIGCVHCRNSGFLGRLAILELLEPGEKIMDLVLNHGSAQAIEDQAIKDGMITLKEGAMKLLIQGKTSLSEYARVI